MKELQFFCKLFQRKHLDQMQANTPLEYGKYYHIYNRGVNGAKLFYTASNYEHFLRLYERYLNPVIDTFAWCLLGNHFHLLIRVKEEQ